MALKMELSRFEEVVFPKAISPNPEINLKYVKEMEYRDGDIIILAYPKSGSHWTESLVRALLRKNVDENILSQSGLIDFIPPEFSKSMQSPRVMLSHLWPDRMPEEHVTKRGKFVLVLRNPKDVVVSSFHHFRRSSTVQNKQTWDEFFESFLTGDVPFGDYFSYMEKWHDALKTNKFDIETFFYEDLKENAIEALKRLAKHIEVSKTDDELAAIVKECSIGSLKSKVDPDKVHPALKDDKNEMIIYRKGEIADWKNHFTVSQNERFEQLMQERMKNIQFKFRYE